MSSRGSCVRFACRARLLAPALGARRAGAPGWEAAGTETTELWAARSRLAQESRAPGPRRERPVLLSRHGVRSERYGRGSGTEINVEDAARPH